MARDSKEAQDRAEASFKRKELQARDAKKATADYEASGQAMREKTARLRTLRLAKEAAEKGAADKKADDKAAAEKEAADKQGTRARKKQP